MRHFAAHQIGFILRGAGNEQIGILCAGLGQHLRVHAVAGDAAQVEALLQGLQMVGADVNHGDVVALGHQTFGHAVTHTASAQDDDFHAPLW